MWKQIPTKRKRRHRTAVAASLLTAFAMTAPLGLAHSATPSNDSTCGGDPATGSPTVFRLSGAWSTWEGGSEARDFVRQALASMETERNIYGTKLTDWEETTGTGQDVTFKIANLPPGVAGEASCQSGEITFDSDFVASATAGNIRNAVRHEAMHYFGAAHTGEEDSRDGLIAGMKTCANGYNAANIIAQDDAATLQYVSETTFSADPCFESTGIEAGTFYMQLWSRWVEYPHNNALACTPNQYTRGGILNPNGAPVNVGAMTKRQEGHPQFLSSSAWVSSVSGSWWNPTPAIEDAQDIQWRAVASAYDSSAQRMQVDLDNLYVEVSG